MNNVLNNADSDIIYISIHGLANMNIDKNVSIYLLDNNFIGNATKKENLYKLY